MSDWATFALDDIATIRIGGTPPRDVDAYWAGESDPGFAWVSIADLNGRIVSETKERITEKGVRNSNVKLIKKGSLMMSFKLSIGRAALAGVELFTNEAIAVIDPKDQRVSQELLYYVLPPQAKSAITDTAVKGVTLNKASLGKLSICVPTDQAVQIKIAHILQTIDDTIEKTEVLIEKYQQIKAGLMHDLFTRGIGADGKLRPPREQAPELYQQTPIGWIPMQWEFEPLKNIFGAKNIVNGPFGSDLLTSELRKEGVPVLYCQDIKPGYFSRISQSNVTQIKAAQLSFCNVRKGDILLAKVGTPPCDSCVYGEDENAVVTQDVIRIRPSSDNAPEFFSSWFGSGYGRKSIRRISIEGTRERVSLGEFKSLVLPKPNIVEQQRISKRINRAQSLIAGTKRELDKLKKLKAGLMHDLLTGKVKVKSEPPAAVHV